MGKPEIMSPEKLSACLKEIYHLETLLAGVERDAERCLGLDGAGARYAASALQFATLARKHFEAGDIREAATWSLKAGATAERLRLETLFSRVWWRQKELSERLKLDRYVISRAVKDKELRTNGRTGQACRIDPFSVVEWCYKKRGCLLEDLLDGKADGFVARSETS